MLCEVTCSTLHRFGELPITLRRTNFNTHILHIRLTALTLLPRSCWHLILVYVRIEWPLRRVTYPHLAMRRAGKKDEESFEILIVLYKHHLRDPNSLLKLVFQFGGEAKS